jgi:DNA-binding MarR family transcriptional regulator
MSPTEPLLFGDVLALAREQWVRTMTASLAAKGYPEYRRSDAVAMRFLQSGSRALGEFSTPMGGSRQATRKVVAGLIERGYATLETDPRDARRRHVVLTPMGGVYAKAVIHTVVALNRDIAERVSPGELSAAYSVLTFVKDALTPVG